MSTATSTDKQDQAARPSAAGRSKLAALREGVAELRTRILAARAEPARREDFGYDKGKLVRLFDPTIRPAKSLSTERGVGRRQEEILTALREKGPFRFIGAQAGPDLAERLGSLRVSHPNFLEAVDHLLQEEALARHRNTGICGIKLLLHGAPGVGKTDFSLRVADILRVNYAVVSMSSAQAGAALAGSEQYWSNSQPGDVWEALVMGREDTPAQANPLFLLDEIDKARGHGGDPLGALFQLLEEGSARVFADKSVPWLPIDASHVNWVATANSLDEVHPAILSRFTVIEPTPLTQEQRYGIVQRLYSAMLAEFDLGGRLDLVLHDDDLERLAGDSVRDAKRRLREAIARALLQGSGQVCIQDAPPKQQRVPIGFIG